MFERNPFQKLTDLMNIETGEVSDVSTNVYSAKEIGDKIIKNIAVVDYSR